MTIALVDLVAQYRAIQSEIDDAIARVLRSGVFILGPNVAAFEEELAAFLGVRYAVGVASGTDALHLALRANGIGPGDEVIVPAYTFVSTAEAVSQTGAVPAFVDIDPATYCIDVADLAAKITRRTKAVVPVHLYGHPADMGPIHEAARDRGLTVIEDNAQALGAEYKGRRTGTLGSAGCLSFYPTKNLGGYGDGGMVVTDNPVVADAVRTLRTHGWHTKYYPEECGWNSRLDELQAAVLRVKLRHLEEWTHRRRAIAERYRALLATSGVGLPAEAPYAKHVYHLYTIRVKERNGVQERLHALGVASGVYYPVPLHETTPYRHLGAARAFPQAQQAARETLAIPLYPEMTEDQIDAVASAVTAAAAAVAGSRR